MKKWSCICLLLLFPVSGIAAVWYEEYDAALKAIGVSDLRIVGMILLQALVVGGIGYAIGMGLCAVFFEITLQQIATRGLVLMWQNMVGTGVLVIFIVMVASLLSIRRVLVLEPAVVFRG